MALYKDNLVIKELEQEDNFEELICLSKIFFFEYEEHHQEFFKIDLISDNDITSYFTKFIKEEDKKAFIAIVDHKIIGYITVYVSEQPRFWEVKRVGDISGLMVHKNYRRSGIANQLFSEAVIFFTAKQIKYYTVFTATNNLKAIAFYENCGLEPIYTTLLGEIKEAIET